MRKTIPFSQALHSWIDISAHHAMRGWSHHARATGLSMPQFSILMQLYYRGHCGISDIRDRFEISAAAASQHVENLVQAGLIERSEGTGDRRVKHIQLSDKGRHLLEKGIRERYHWMDNLEVDLDEATRERIAEALVSLTEAARKLDQD